MSVSTVTPEIRIEADIPISPLELTPAAWYRPESLSALAAGAAVAQWNDDSGNGRHLVQGSAGLRPTIKHNAVNARSAVRFDGTRRLEGNGFPLSAILGADGVGTVYAVFWIDAAAPAVNALVAAGSHPDVVQLHTTGVIAASAVARVAVAGSLSAVSRFQGALSARAEVATVLSLSRWFDGALFAKATVAAALTTAIPLAAAASAGVTVAGSLAAPSATAAATDQLVALSYDGTPDSAGKAVSRDAWNVGVWRRDSGTLFVAANGQDTASMIGVANGPVTAAALASTVVRVGSDVGGASTLRGYVAELIVFNTAHDAATRRRMSKYLVRKFGLTADATAAPAEEWINISSDVVSGVKAAWGVRGDSPNDRVAEPGELSFDLDNGATNSAGMDGYYSLKHARTRPGFALGTEVRLVLSYSLFGTRVKWRGTIESAPAAAGVRDPRTRVTCADWMEEAARGRPSGLAVLVDAQSDKVFEALLGAVAKQPPASVSIAG